MFFRTHQSTHTHARTHTRTGRGGDACLQLPPAHALSTTDAIASTATADAAAAAAGGHAPCACRGGLPLRGVGVSVV
jgi:hypothetical protein